VRGARRVGIFQTATIRSCRGSSWIVDVDDTRVDEGLERRCRRDEAGNPHGQRVDDLGRHLIPRDRVCGVLQHAGKVSSADDRCQLTEGLVRQRHDPPLEVPHPVAELPELPRAEQGELVAGIPEPLEGLEHLDDPLVDPGRPPKQQAVGGTDTESSPDLVTVVAAQDRSVVRRGREGRASLHAPGGRRSTPRALVGRWRSSARTPGSTRSNGSARSCPDELPESRIESVVDVEERRFVVVDIAERAVPEPLGQNAEAK
jgi:hypothetical protein